MTFDFLAGRFTADAIDADRTALAGTDRTLTWAETRAEVERLSEIITSHRAGAGPVMIYGHKEAGMVTAILACLHARVPYVPVDTIVPAARVQSILDIAAVDFVLATGPDVVAHALNINVPTGRVTGARPTAAPAWTGADNLAYIIFTSGSTGEPKGVQIQRSNVNDLVDWVRSDDFKFTPADVILSQCSYSFDVSFFDVIAAFAGGGTLILGSPSHLKDLRPWTNLAAPPTVWSSTPSFLSLALTAPGFDQTHFPQLRRFYVAGEAVHAALVKRVNQKFPDAEFWNAYGPTEATVITTLVRVTPELIERYPTIPIGRVKPGVRMPTGADDGASEGELSIIGPNISPGYLNRPDLNQTRFGKVDGVRSYLTGDLGFHRDGFVFYQGRIDSQIKLHGYRIELDEIDNHAAALDEVEVAATIGLRRGGEVKKLVCFLQPTPGAVRDGLTDRVRRALEKTLPYYMIPADFRVIERIPYNTNHKVDRGALTDEAMR